MSSGGSFRLSNVAGFNATKYGGDINILSYGRFSFFSGCEFTKSAFSINNMGMGEIVFSYPNQSCHILSFNHYGVATTSRVYTSVTVTSNNVLSIDTLNNGGTNCIVYLGCSSGGSATISNCFLNSGASTSPRYYASAHMSGTSLSPIKIKNLSIQPYTYTWLYYFDIDNLTWTPGDGIVYNLLNGTSYTVISNFTSQYSGIYIGSNGACVSKTNTLLNYTVGANTSIYIAPTGTATSMTVNSNGRIEVMSGGNLNVADVGVKGSD